MVLSLQGWRFSRIWSIYWALQMFFWYLFFVVMLEGFLVFCQRQEKVYSTEILGWEAAGEEGTGNKSCSEFSSSSPSLPPGTFLRCKIPVKQKGIICRSCCCPVRRTWCSWPSVEKARAFPASHIKIISVAFKTASSSTSAASTSRVHMDLGQRCSPNPTGFGPSFSGEISSWKRWLGVGVSILGEVQGSGTQCWGLGDKVGFNGFLETSFPASVVLWFHGLDVWCTVDLFSGTVFPQKAQHHFICREGVGDASLQVRRFHWTHQTLSFTALTEIWSSFLQPQRGGKCLRGQSYKTSRLWL